MLNSKKSVGLTLISNCFALILVVSVLGSDDNFLMDRSLPAGLSGLTDALLFLALAVQAEYDSNDDPTAWGKSISSLDMKINVFWETPGLASRFLFSWGSFEF